MAVYEAKTMLSPQETMEACRCLDGLGTHYDDSDILYCTEELTFENGYSMNLRIEDVNADEPYVVATLFDDLGEYISSVIGNKDEFFDVWTLNDESGNVYKGEFEGAQRTREKPLKDYEYEKPKDPYNVTVVGDRAKDREAELLKMPDKPKSKSKGYDMER